MLCTLRIRDLVLIDDLDLELSPGFNVLTGETGAGKSLVATAVKLLLGGEAGPDVVRRGAEAAEVEGVFDIFDDPRVKSRLEEAGLPAEDELLVRRVVPAEGRQRTFINGRLASRALLTELSRDLVSLAGQHEHLALLDRSRQLEMLDAFGGLGGDAARMAGFHAAATDAESSCRSLLDRERDRAQRLDYLAFQAREIDDLDPQPGEMSALDGEIERLGHLEAIQRAVRNGCDALYEADGSVFERLGEVLRELSEAAAWDGSLSEVAANLGEAATLVEEAARDLSRRGGDDQDAPGRLDELVERRDALAGLARKHGRDLSGILEYRREIEEEIAKLSRYEEARAEAERERDRARGEALAFARALSKKRKKAGAGLSRSVADEISGLGMTGASFDVVLEPGSREPGPTGLDLVEFVVALNPGEGAHPLRETASGGELSRLMLAIRRSLSGVGPVGAYVFDEVDAGIGGAQAAAVGSKLREVAKHHQVVCITHLPQIAGLADAHFAVTKHVERGRTLTRVIRLNDEERVDEVARMLGGGDLTEPARAAARELMNPPRSAP